MEGGPVASVGKTWLTIRTKLLVWLSFDSTMRGAVKGVVTNAIFKILPFQNTQFFGGHLGHSKKHFCLQLHSKKAENN